MPIDYSSPLQYLWALLPETVLSLGALVVLMVDVFQRGDSREPARPAVAWLTVLFLAGAAVANGWLLGLEDAAPAGPIALDAFRVFTNFLFLGAAALFVPLSWRFLGQEGMRHGELYVLVMLATVGMMFFAGTRDLMLIFLGLELMSVAVYVLTGLNRRDRRSAEAALKYFLLGAFSSAFFLFGIAMVYGGAGSVNLTIVRAAVGIDGVGANLLLTSGMAFLAVGFAFKVAAVPFHMWTPDAYEGAPAPVTAFMAAAVKAAAFAAFLRVFLVGFGGMWETWGLMTFWLAVATMVVANLVALAEDSVKRMLAYSSISHAGFLLMPIAAGNALAVACTMPARWVSSKSSRFELVPLMHAALRASKRSPRPSSVACGGPEKSRSVAIITSTVSSRQPPIAQPSQLRIARAASCRTSSGTSLQRESTRNRQSVRVTSVMRCE